MPAFGHLPYVMGEGNKKLSKRDPQSSLNLYRERGFLPEGLLNYLSLLGWSLAADRDVFSLDEMVAAFDISGVNANPARFDLKKCRGDQRRPHPAAGRRRTFIAACEPWLQAPHAPWAPEALRRGRLRGAGPAGPDPADGPLRHHRQRRLPLPGRAGRGRGVLDEGHEAGRGRAAAHRPSKLAERRTGAPSPSRRPSSPPVRSTASSWARPRPRSASRSPAARSVCRCSSPWRSWAASARWPVSTRRWRSWPA